MAKRPIPEPRNSLSRPRQRSLPNNLSRTPETGTDNGQKAIVDDLTPEVIPPRSDQPRRRSQGTRRRRDDREYWNPELGKKVRDMVRQKSSLETGSDVSRSDTLLTDPDDNNDDDVFLKAAGSVDKDYLHFYPEDVRQSMVGNRKSELSGDARDLDGCNRPDSERQEGNLHVYESFDK